MTSWYERFLTMVNSGRDFFASCLSKNTLEGWPLTYVPDSCQHIFSCMFSRCTQRLFVFRIHANEVTRSLVNPSYSVQGRCYKTNNLHSVSSTFKRRHSQHMTPVDPIAVLPKDRGWAWMCLVGESFVLYRTFTTVLFRTNWTMTNYPVACVTFSLPSHDHTIKLTFFIPRK